MEFRGHEHVVECLVFAPVTANELINELIGGNNSNNTNSKQVSLIYYLILFFLFNQNSYDKLTILDEYRV